MFRRFYGLRENPFRINPDPRFLYVNSEVQESLAALVYGIRSRKGIVLLTGEVGTGKTTLINALLNYLRREKAATSYIFNARDDAKEFLELVLADFDVPCPSTGKSQMLLRFNHWLLERYRAGQMTVLIVDEAQNLSWDVLEEVRLLTNLETSTDKLLQIVLAGQPELEQKLAQPRIRQLAQRIAFWCRTKPLDLEQTGEYIKRRLTIAGANGKTIFSEEAVAEIHRQSQGIPRIVNLLCEHAMIHGFVDGLQCIAAETISRAARDLTFPIGAERNKLSENAALATD